MGQLQKMWEQAERCRRSRAPSPCEVPSTSAAAARPLSPQPSTSTGRGLKRAMAMANVKEEEGVRDEKRRGEEERRGPLCCVCQVRDVDICLLPCTHAIMCGHCITQFPRINLSGNSGLVFVEGGEPCPVCRAPI